jgi:hypothetical protein
MFLFKWSRKSKGNGGPLMAGPLLPGEAPRVIVSESGVVARKDSDGSITISQPDGSKYVMDAEGNTKGEVRNISSVTIADISYVTEHHVNRIYDTVSHVVRFLNGGTLSYSFSTSGQMIDFESDKLQVALMEGNHIVIGCTEMALAFELRKKDYA